MNICCDNWHLAKKQRDEIVLMTKQLEEQEGQLDRFHANSLKYKEEKKGLENQMSALERTINSQKIEIAKLKERLTSDVHEFEGLRGKLKDKDLYIQSQSGKLIKVQTLADKSVSELNELRKKNSELKSENAKLGVKCKEQTTRILELREKNEKIKKEIETKNNLIRTSDEHIQALERNLKKLVDFTDQMKENKTFKKNAADNEVKNSSLKSSSSSLIWTVETPRESKLTNSDVQLANILQTLKETWLESNVKYEEVKNMLVTKINESAVDSTLPTNLEDISLLSRMATSSPINVMPNG